MSVRAALGRTLALLTLVILVAACGSPVAPASPPSMPPSPSLTLRDAEYCEAMARSEADHRIGAWRSLGDAAAERSADRTGYVAFLASLVAHLDQDVVDDHDYFGTDWPSKIARLRRLVGSLSQPATQEGYKTLIDESESAIQTLLVKGSGHDLAEACQPIRAGASAGR